MHEIVAHVGHECAKRGRQARKDRYGRSCDAELAHETAHMQWSSSAEGNEPELSDIEPTLHGRESHSSCHVLGDDLEDRFRGLLSIESECTTDPFVDRAPC